MGHGVGDHTQVKAASHLQGVMNPLMSLLPPYKELILDHFRIFCSYRFYNSHLKAMQIRKEEVDQIIADKKKERDSDDLFVTQNAAMSRLKQKSTTVKSKLNQMQEFDQYNLFKRKNNYNEDDGDFG